MSKINYSYNHATSCENAYYTVQEINRDYGLISFGYDEDKNIFHLSSTLLHAKKDKIKKFERIVTKGGYITNNEDTFINEDVIPFITNCSKVGTVHGFMDLYSIIIQYFDNLDQYSKYKILIYKDSQQGLLDIINHLCHLNAIDRNNLIFIESNKIYKFKSICFIKNIYDAWFNKKPEYSNFLAKCRNFTSNYIIDKVSYLKPQKFNIDNILIVKAGSNDWKQLKRKKNIINFDKNEVEEFCKKYNYTWIKPETMNEVVFYNLINNGKNFVISFGSSFLKNFPFINKNYEKVNIVSVSNSKYDQQMIKLFNSKTWESKKKELNLKTDINFHSLKSFKDFELK